MFADSRVIVLSDVHSRWRRSTELSEEERLFDATKPWRMSLNAGVRDYVRDAAAEIDASVWQQIASGERDMTALHNGAVTCVRRIKRRALRYRERESPLTVGVEGAWHCVDDFAPDVVGRVAASQLVSCLPGRWARSAREQIERSL